MLACGRYGFDPLGPGDGAPQPPIDGEQPPCVPAACAAAGGLCVSGECLFDCPTNAACMNQITCPAGMPCRIACTGLNSCKGAIDCGGASSCVVGCLNQGTCTDTVTCHENCAIICQGQAACAAPLLCGPGRCNIECRSLGTCALGYDCSTSCRCTASCGSEAVCGGTLACPSGCASGNACTDDGVGCVPTC